MFSNWLKSARRWLPAAGLVLWLAAGAGCRGSARQGLEYLAIGPFENLSGDPALDWVSVALAEVIGTQIAGSPEARVYVTGPLRDPANAGATRFLHGYFYRVGDRLRATATLEEVARRKVLETVTTVKPIDEGVLPVAAEIAAELISAPEPYSTSSERALRAYVEGRQSRDPVAARPRFEEAIDLDPRYSAAYVALSRLLVAQGDRAGARDVLARAFEREDQLAPADHARLRLFQASLDEDRSGQRAALETLARLTPADSAVYRRLAELDVQKRDFASAANWYQRATAIEPRDISLWNQLGYVRAYGRDLQGARQALETYRGLAPASANPYDSLGDVHFYLGRFDEAVRFYLEAAAKEPAFLEGKPVFKAAFARLMAGDREGADSLFERYLSDRGAASDPLIGLRQAQWNYLTGKRRQAFEQLSAVVRQDRMDARAKGLALAQLGVWSLARGERAEARAYAEEAGKLPGDLAIRRLALLGRFLALEPGPPELWRERAAAAFPGDPQKTVRELAVGYAMVFARDFGEARKVFRSLLQEVSVLSSEPVTLLLAWSLIETGAWEEAREWLAVNPVQQLAGEQIYGFLTFPRIFLLRAQAAENAGDAGEARRNRQLYDAYRGDTPSIFDQP